LRLTRLGELVLDEPLPSLQRLWSETSHALQRLRDNPECADAELDRACDWSRPGMSARLSFVPDAGLAPAMISRGSAGCGYSANKASGVEMAAAFDLAGFDSVTLCQTD
jgi:phosphoribosylformylglycinamidine synthase